MAEDITTEDTQEPRKFRDRKEYLEFLAEQKALKDKESNKSNERTFETFDKDSHVSKKDKPQYKEQIDNLRSILTAVNNNTKISNQILAKLNQRIVKESVSEESNKLKNITDKITELKINVNDLKKTAESLKIAILERPVSSEQQSERLVESLSNNRPEQQVKIVERNPQYITNIRQCQYKRNPRLKTNRRESIVSGLGRKVGTYIGGRGLGNVIAKSIKVGERTTGAILKSPFKLAAKTVRVATGRSTRDTLLKANRAAETSKFRKKMLDLLGIISKKDTQTATTTQTSSSNGLANLLKLGGAAALAGGIASTIPAIKERFTKNEDGTFGPEHKGGIERVKNLANNMAEASIKILKSFGQGVKEAADKHLLEFAENNHKRFNDIKTKIEDFGKSILDVISNIINKAYEKISGTAGKIADTAMDVSKSVYNAPKTIATAVSNKVSDSDIGKAYTRIKNEAIAQNKMPDYKGGNINELSNLSDKIVPGDNYNNIANSLNKRTASPTLKQLEEQQKQSDDLQRNRNKKALEPIIINNTSNTTESPKQPSVVRLGTRNLDSSNMQLQRTQLVGSYIGTGFLVN